MADDESERKPALIALADAIKEWFPEMGGRVLAVSEVDPFTNANKPTLPLVTLGLSRGTGEHANNGNGRITLTDDYLIVFMLEPERYKRRDKSESPFWAYYDYDAIRDKLLSNINGWRTPLNAGLMYRQMDIEADEFAVYVTFTFRSTYFWCDPFEQMPRGTFGKDMRISSRVCAPVSQNCGPLEKEDEEQPCPAFKPNDEA